MSDYTARLACTKCGIEKPLTADFFRPRKESKTGFYRACRECERAYCAENAEKASENSKRWRTNNPDKKREYDKRYRTENAEQRREYDKRYYAENAENVRKKGKRWRQANPDKVKAKEYRRRARGRGNANGFTAADAKRMFEHFDHKCAICGRSADLFLIIAVDHWIPLARGGSNTPDNCVPLCHTRNGGGSGNGCNNSKHDHDPVGWLTEKLGKRKAAQVLARIEAYFESVSLICPHRAELNH